MSRWPCKRRREGRKRRKKFPPLSLCADDSIKLSGVFHANLWNSSFHQLRWNEKNRFLDASWSRNSEGKVLSHEDQVLTEKTIIHRLKRGRCQFWGECCCCLTGMWHMKMVCHSCATGANHCPPAWTDSALESNCDDPKAGHRGRRGRVKVYTVFIQQD